MTTGGGGGGTAMTAGATTTGATGTPTATPTRTHAKELVDAHSATAPAQESSNRCFGFKIVSPNGRWMRTTLIKVST